MPFRFRLEKVLRVRQELVDKQSRRVGEAQHAVTRIVQKQTQLRKQIQETLDSPQAVATTDPVTRRNRRAWLDHLESIQAELTREMHQASQALEVERTRLTEVWRDLEVMKKLKKRQKEAWHEEQSRRETREIDEIGQLRAERARREKLARDREQDSPMRAPGGSGGLASGL